MPEPSRRSSRGGSTTAWPPEPGHGQRWLEANDDFRRDVLALLADEGPLLSREIPDTAAVPWESSGWTSTRNVTMMLELLNVRGHVAIVGREGRERLWDLAARVYPPVEPVPEPGQDTIAVLRELGLATGSGSGPAGPAGS